ncbi:MULTISPECIES: DUF3747 domain-containing protein, partial [Spirulina sp. CCY15215]|uniref:DUF3747 domain-containing protein n=1 Tax=Spirulina sp. CCY15215 TaxID=2767591 RepID=UPI0019504925
MKFLHKLTATLTTTILFSAGMLAPARAAYDFAKVEVDQRRFVAIATPFGVGRRYYNLIIMEQQANGRNCWQENGENPTFIEPTWESFDFTGICGRSTDSNGYSARINDTDLGWRFILSVVQRGDELVLLANSPRERTTIEIGRTRGMDSSDRYLKIHLDPGWRFTKRTYNGRALGHVYLTSDSNTANIPPVQEPPGILNPPSNTSLPPADRELIFTPEPNPQPTAPAPRPRTTTTP